MKTSALPIALMLCLVGACAHAPADIAPAADAATAAGPRVDPALLAEAGMRRDEYVLRHEHHDLPMGFRDLLLLATAPVQARDGLCTTTVRSVALYPPEAAHAAEQTASGRVVFRPAAGSGCAKRMTGEYFYADEAALPALKAALALVDRRDFGKPTISRLCLGQFPADYAADKGKLMQVASNKDGLRFLYIPELPTWTLSLQVNAGPQGPVLASAALDCTQM